MTIDNLITQTNTQINTHTHKSHFHLTSQETYKNYKTLENDD